ncbi:MAG: DUF1206 domain-containing protein [Chloroflexi bacterium]|nr:MAG: DUF1206 domain-containing protein [Chloroflexota bacterium]TME19076.1 MAG: DUF1206 domain-containing protein [Chloroflexota bacterium]
MRDAASNRWLRLAERLGYVVRGLLYGTMGVLAFGLALGIGGQGTDQRGSLLVLGGLPLGAVFLALAVTGLAAYSLWGLTRALYDPLHAGSGPVGLAERAGFLWSGLTYGALAVFGVQVLSGHSGTGGSGLSGPAAAFLASPAGRLAAAIGGLIGLGAGAAQLVEVYRADFRRYLKRGRMTKAEREAVDTLGRYGMLARAVTFGLVGWFLLSAGLAGQPGRVRGFGGALAFLAGVPFGRLLLGVVSLGFIALGLHSAGSALWAKLEGDES